MLHSFALQVSALPVAKLETKLLNYSILILVRRFRSSALADLDGAILVIDLEPRGAAAHGSACRALAMVAADLDLIEVAFDIAVARARRQVEGCLRRQHHLDVAFAVVNLYAAQGQLAGVHFYAAVAVFHLDVATHIIQVNVLRAGD